MVGQTISHYKVIEKLNRNLRAWTPLALAIACGALGLLWPDWLRAQGSSPQTWTATGDMAVTRRDHTATRLNDGKVLIVGPTRPGPAELYDPTTGTFSPTDSTVFFHGELLTATRLADGKVLIVGGTIAPQSAELYDPSTETFTATAGSPNEVHEVHTATLLPDGRVLIAAGAVAELYDPVTDTFSLTGALNEDRGGHTATLLPNGQVLITGGPA